MGFSDVTGHSLGMSVRGLDIGGLSLLWAALGRWSWAGGPGKVVLDCGRKLAERELEREPAGSISPRFLLQVLP